MSDFRDAFLTSLVGGFLGAGIALGTLAGAASASARWARRGR